MRPRVECADTGLRGAIDRLAARSRYTTKLIAGLWAAGQWPPLVLSPVLVECLRGDPGRDAPVNRLLKTCDLVEGIPQRLARRAAFLRVRAHRGSAMDALVVAAAEPGGIGCRGSPCPGRLRRRGAGRFAVAAAPARRMLPA